MVRGRAARWHACSSDMHCVAFQPAWLCRGSCICCDAPALPPPHLPVPFCPSPPLEANNHPEPPPCCLCRLSAVLTMLDEPGRLPRWERRTAPAAARAYYGLGPEATVK